MSSRHEQTQGQRHLFAVPTVKESDGSKPELDSDVLYDLVLLMDLQADLDAKLTVVSAEIDKIVAQHGPEYLDTIGAGRIEDVTPPNFAVQIIREEI
jgi:hypothetical protein